MSPWEEGCHSPPMALGPRHRTPNTQAEPGRGGFPASPGPCPRPHWVGLGPALGGEQRQTKPLGYKTAPRPPNPKGPSCVLVNDTSAPEKRCLSVPSRSA